MQHEQKAEHWLHQLLEVTFREDLLQGPTRGHPEWWPANTNAKFAIYVHTCISLCSFNHKSIVICIYTSTVRIKNSNASLQFSNNYYLFLAVTVKLLFPLFEEEATSIVEIINCTDKNDTKRINI